MGLNISMCSEREVSQPQHCPHTNHRNFLKPGSHHQAHPLLLFSFIAKKYLWLCMMQNKRDENCSLHLIFLTSQTLSKKPMLGLSPKTWDIILFDLLEFATVLAIPDALFTKANPPCFLDAEIYGIDILMTSLPSNTSTCDDWGVMIISPTHTHWWS